MWACTRAKTLTKPLAMLTYILALVTPASVDQQVLAAAFLTSVDWSPLCPTLISLTASFYRLVSAAPFCWLFPSLDCSLMPAVLFCSLLLTVLWDHPSLVPTSRGRSRAQALLCGFCAKIDKGILWLAPTHTHTSSLKNVINKLCLLIIFNRYVYSIKPNQTKPVPPVFFPSS